MPNKKIRLILIIVFCGFLFLFMFFSVGCTQNQKLDNFSMTVERDEIDGLIENNAAENANSVRESVKVADEIPVTGEIATNKDMDDNYFVRSAAKNVVDKGKVAALVVIASKEFKTLEFQGVKEALGNRGIGIVVSSSAVVAEGYDPELRLDTDLLLQDVVVDDFDAIVFIGGRGAVEYYERDVAHSLINEFYEKGKIVSAICLSPSILANAGVLGGKRATAYISEKSNL